MSRLSLALRLVCASALFRCLALPPPASAANSASAPPCKIENILIQSFFAFDAFYDAGNEQGQEILRNRFIFLGFMKHFLFQMENKTDVDSFNGIFAFGDSIKKVVNFTDDAGGNIDLQELKTSVGKKTVLDALEVIVDEFDDIEDPQIDYVRLGILITDRPLKANTPGSNDDDDDDDDDDSSDDDDNSRLSTILSTIKSEKIVMYAVGRPSNRANLLKIVGGPGHEDRLIINNFTDSQETMNLGEKFQDVLCRGIEDNRQAMALVMGAGAIAGIVIAVVVALIIAYVLKKHAYDKYQLQRLAEAKEAMKNKSETNRLYKDPTTKTNLADLGVQIDEN